MNCTSSTSLKPVSSSISLTADSSLDSPFSILPLGRSHLPSLLMKRILPSGIINETSSCLYNSEQLFETPARFHPNSLHTHSVPAQKYSPEDPKRFLKWYNFHTQAFFSSSSGCLDSNNFFFVDKNFYTFVIVKNLIQK